jgi:RHS repeat-associated protein
LTQETLLDGTTIAYEYDGAGNRTKKTVTKGSTTATTSHTYDVGNQLADANGQAYSYDANGNLTGNGSKTFIYNEENRLVEVKDSAGATLATFTYDHEGRRISKTTSNGTIYFHYSGDKVIYEADANNNIIAEYTWDAHGNPVSMIKGGVTYYYHINGHGDVTELTDATGTVVAEYQYDAWGNIISQSGTMASVNPYRYAGYQYDEATGLYYLMARYYDASIGRFITRDTFHGFEDNPLSLNQYAYTENNPVIYIDPSGYYRTNFLGGGGFGFGRGGVSSGNIKVHKNSNSYVGHQSVYQIRINGEVNKYGKADMTKTASTGDPVRLQSQVNKLQKQNPDSVVSGKVVYENKSISTADIKKVETKYIQNYYNNNSVVPPGNINHPGLLK